MRKLAHVEEIVSIRPIAGADKIELATVLGWQVVVAKSDNFKVGDKVVYIEIDSIVPPLPEFEFLKERKYRVRTIKLRGEISQGLVLPMRILGKNYSVGADVTDVLGIVKYDPQADKERKELEEKAAREKNKIKATLMRMGFFRRLFSKPSRNFPSFIKKTDEERIQNMPKILETEKDTRFEVTEKLDGQSVTYFLIAHRRFFGLIKDYVFGVCSRNLLLSKPNDSSYWTIAKKYDIENKMKELIRDEKYLVIQGEIIGTGIQGNKYGVSGYDFYAFNMFGSSFRHDNKTMKQYLSRVGIKTVPLLDDFFKLPESMEELVRYAVGESTLAPVKREGVVIRNKEKNISFKVINPEFLLKFEE